MKLLILCVVLRNYHDISTVRARATELITSDTEGDVIISPSSAGLVAATRAGQRGGLLQPTAVEGAERSPPGMLQAGMLGAASRGGVWANGVQLMQPIMDFSPLSPNWANQTANGLCKVIPRETEPIIRRGFLTAGTHLHAFPKHCKVHFCRKPIKVERAGKRTQDCIPMEPKTMASLNVIKSIIK